MAVLTIIEARGDKKNWKGIKQKDVSTNTQCDVNTVVQHSMASRLLTNQRKIINCSIYCSHALQFVTT